MSDPIPRREFIRRLGSAALVAGGVTGAAAWLANRSGREESAVAPPLPSFRPFEFPEGAPDLVAARGTDASAMVRAALEEIGGIGRIVGRGDRVLIKPNVAFDRDPSLGATTSPAVVAEVVRCCREAGAREVVVAENPINSPEGCFRRSGVGEAAVAAGARLLWPSPGAFGPADLQGGILRSWPVFRRPLDEADVLIGIPTAKVHNLCGASLSMKNWYGFLGGGRNRLHQRIHEAIRDLAAAFRPSLIVMDATRLLIRHGPTGGSRADVRPGPGVVVGADPVAIDALACTWLGKRPEEIAYLALAEEAGLGAADLRTHRFREIDAG